MTSLDSDPFPLKLIKVGPVSISVTLSLLVSCYNLALIQQVLTTS